MGGPQVVGAYHADVVGDVYGVATVCQQVGRHESVGRLGPFQGHIRSFLGVKGDEPTIDPPALLFHHTRLDLNAGVAKHSDARTVDFAERINHSHHYFRDARLDDELGTGRSAAVMGARLQIDIEGRVFEQLFPVD